MLAKSSPSGDPLSQTCPSAARQHDSNLVKRSTGQIWSSAFLENLAVGGHEVRAFGRPVVPAAGALAGQHPARPRLTSAKFDLRGARGRAGGPIRYRISTMG
jgi:hypothetical protein